MEEALGVDGFLCFDWVFVVAHEGVASAVADLSWVGAGVPSSSEALFFLMVISVPGRAEPISRKPSRGPWELREVGLDMFCGPVLSLMP